MARPDFGIFRAPQQTSGSALELICCHRRHRQWRPLPAGEACAHGFYIEPTVFADVPADSSLAQDEIFGPVLAIMRVRNLDEAIALANRVLFGLSGFSFENKI